MLVLHLSDSSINSLHLDICAPPPCLTVIRDGGGGGMGLLDSSSFPGVVFVVTLLNKSNQIKSRPALIKLGQISF